MNNAFLIFLFGIITGATAAIGIMVLVYKPFVYKPVDQSSLPRPVSEYVPLAPCMEWTQREYIDPVTGKSGTEISVPCIRRAEWVE